VKQTLSSFGNPRLTADFFMMIGFCPKGGQVVIPTAKIRQEHAFTAGQKFIFRQLQGFGVIPVPVQCLCWKRMK
jgi:hypothetical protein